VRPSSRSSVHHAVVYLREPGSKWLAGQPEGKVFSVPLSEGFTTSDLLMVYTPGNSFDQWPPGVAKRIKAGSDLVLQMHYTANGRATEDRTRIGIVFATEPPKQAVLSLQMSNDRFVSPAIRIIAYKFPAPCPTMRCSSACSPTCICAAKRSNI